MIDLLKRWVCAETSRGFREVWEEYGSGKLADDAFKCNDSL